MIGIIGCAKIYNERIISIYATDTSASAFIEQSKKYKFEPGLHYYCNENFGICIYGAPYSAIVAVAHHEMDSRVLGQFVMELFSIDCDITNREIRDKIIWYNSSPKLVQLRSSVAEVKEILIQNIDALLERQEKISLLVDRSTELENSAHGFYYSSSSLRRQMWCYRIKIGILIFLMVLGFFAIIVSFFYLLHKV